MLSTPLRALALLVAAAGLAGCATPLDDADADSDDDEEVGVARAGLTAPIHHVVQDLGSGTADSFTLNVVLSDAISRPLCTPAAVISGAGRSDYCSRFPPDLSASAIRANVKGYLGTAFQTDDWLRSTPLAGADNVPFNPGKPRGLAAANHRALYTLPLVWGGFRSRFQYR
jgi:hypothetical protein